ncbi:MAG: ABC transporter permease [Candidatus Xenobia bacterium]
MARSAVREALTSLGALLLALLIAGIVIAISGRDPVLAFQALFHGAFGTRDNLTDTINKTAPLILTGLSVAFAFRCGLFNIGGEGQYLLGGLFAIAAGVLFKGLPGIALVPICLLAGALAGAAWGGIAAWMKARFGVHEVISTIMLNWIAFYITVYCVNKSWLADTKSHEGTWKVTRFAVVPHFIHSAVFTGIVIALVLAAGLWYVLERTWIGYEVKAVGYSPLAAEYGGVSIARNMIVAMAVSGALAALAGAIDYPIYGRIPSTVSFLGKGFDGIAVALIGRNQPFGVVLAALVFGALAAGNTDLQIVAHVPKDVTAIVQALIILFMVAPDLIQSLLPMLRPKAGEA